MSVRQPPPKNKTKQFSLFKTFLSHNQARSHNIQYNDANRRTKTADLAAGPAVE